MTNSEVIVVWHTASNPLPPGTVNYTSAFITPNVIPTFGTFLEFREGEMVMSEAMTVDASQKVTRVPVTVDVQKSDNAITATYKASSFPGLTKTFGWGATLLVDGNKVSTCPSGKGFANYP